uniref:Cyclin-dependent kinase inhibitor domain-containing protein n=1 Tax=Parascaris equorum TaxID=6256 RepID=A0A914RAG4_PAREQ
MRKKTRLRSPRTLAAVSSSAGSSMNTTEKKDPARRCLFGKPGKEEVDAWLIDSLKELDGNRASRFNFDFENDRPLEDQDGDYAFEAVDETMVPSFYRTKVYTPDEHRRRIAPPSVATLETDTLEDDATDE